MSRLVPHYAQAKTAFFCCDLQGAFAPRIANFSNCVFVANRFASVHQAIPEYTKYIVTEQYPKGLGKTVPEVKLPETAHVLEKTRFSMLTPEVKALLDDVEMVVLFGIEGHVCVLQTAAELLDLKKRVVLSVDGVGSQTTTDRDTALKLMQTWGPGCTLSTSESILLQLARDAKDPKFKLFSGLLKDQPPIPL